LSGTNSNIYKGITTLTKGVLQLGRINATAIPGDLIINNFSKEVINWNGSDQFAPTSNIYMNCINGILNIGNFQEKINVLVMVSGSQINTGPQGILIVNKLTYNNVNLSSGTYNNTNCTFINGTGKVIVM
jgi:hypothetical protein